MDDYLDHFLSTSSWSDVNATERSSWDCNGTAQRGGILPSMMVNYVVDDKQSPMNLIPSTHMVESLVNEGTSVLVGGDSNYGIDNELLGRDAQSQHEILDQQRNLLHGNSNAGYMGLQFNNCTSNLGILNHSSPELLPIFGGSTQSPSAPPESGSVGSNDTETSVVHPSLRDSHSISSIPQLWPTPPYGGVCSLSPAVGQDKAQGFALPAEFVDTDANIFGNRYLGEDKNQHMGTLPTSVTGQKELHNHLLSSFAANSHIPLERTSGLNSQSQSQNAPTTAPGGCNGAPKPRVRARRGQATDPHSIAERLRREKIAERMKNLQELIPNSNKADKASMLDEIIEYVKFLQLQVKVLSMSRLGAAGAVVPLITEGQTEGNGGLLLSPPTDQGADGDSADDIAFEEEIVKLMESNVTAAMQYLQTKGLCLMPVALAAAISSKKASSSTTSGSAPENASTPNFPNGLLPSQNNGSTRVGNGGISADVNNSMKADNAVSLHKIHESTGKGCNGIAVKLEEAATNSV